MSGRNSRARIAVAALFLTNGALFANLLPRFPEIKTDLAMSNAAYGGARGGVLRRRADGRAGRGRADPAVRSARVAASCTAVALAAFIVRRRRGLVTADVRRRAVRRRRQRCHHRRRAERQRPSAATQLRTVDHQLAARGLVRRRHRRRSDGGRPRSPCTSRGPSHLASRGWCSARSWRSPTRTCCAAPTTTTTLGADAGGRDVSATVYLSLLALVGIAIAGATVEDAGSSWATLYLRDSLDAPGPVAPLGYVALVAFMFVGRLIGDRLVDRFGERAVARAGGVITAAGMGTALAFPIGTRHHRGVRGRRAGGGHRRARRDARRRRIPGLRAGTGLTLLTWLMRVGFLGAPLIVGVVADAASLRVGLLTVPVAGVDADPAGRQCSAGERAAETWLAQCGLLRLEQLVHRVGDLVQLLGGVPAQPALGGQPELRRGTWRPAPRGIGPRRPRPRRAPGRDRTRSPARWRGWPAAASAPACSTS